MKKLLILAVLFIGLFSSCSKSDSNNVSPSPNPTPVASANVSVTSYYIDQYNSYQIDVICTNSGNATAYNVNVKIYTWSSYYSGYYYLTCPSILPGQTVIGSVNCSSVYYPSYFYYTVYSPTWN
jgi:hypothetical protein